MTYYTVQIHLCNGEKIELKDFTAEQTAKLRDEVWIKGIKRESAPKTWELISPLLIKNIYLILQDQKYSVL